MSLKSYSTTAASNTSAPPNGAPEGWALSDINNTIRQVMADVRTLAASNTIASATTCDLGTLDETFLTITNASGSAIAITGLGTVSAGIYKFATFNGVSAISLTHNATSLILPGAANITTVAGDTALFLSLGAGNWKCMFYQAVTAASYQLLDADLTAIAALTTTAFGRGVLTYADAATAFAALKQAATTAATGVVELATTAEAAAGTDTARAVTPAGLNASVLGMGQTWKATTKALATPYTNSTGRAIVVFVNSNASTSAAYVTITVDGLLVANSANCPPYTSDAGSSAIVPPGSTYEFNGTGLASSRELS